MAVKREVPVEEAIGLTLAHDLTRIVPGEFKGRAFAKGHVIQPEDVPALLDIGKRYIYVLALDDTEYHENDAAILMANAVAGDGLIHTDVHEGKVVLKAAYDGMLVVDEERTLRVNVIDGIAFTTRRPFIHVNTGMSVAGIRPIPLVIEKDKVEQVQRIAGDSPLVSVWPYRRKTVALVTTGSEIASGRIQDKSGPILRTKLAQYGMEVIRQVFPGDEQVDITAHISQAVVDGIDMVCVTGGMSVDPDDRSPASIRAAADRVVSYGTPMQPGSMMMLAYAGDTAIFGLPGAVIYDQTTSFDILLPRVVAGYPVTKEDIARHGVGGWLNA